MAYRIVYKCSLCGELVISGGSINADKQTMRNNINKSMRLSEEFAGSPHLGVTESRYAYHNCKDGSIGVAYIAGAKTER